MESSRDASRGSLTALGLIGGIALAGAIAGLSFLYVWQTNRIQELTAASEDARMELEAEQQINHILSVRIDEAFSLERVARIAREQLDMSEPTIIRYVLLPGTDSQ